jgi:delta8-fatty-acid desaturase
VHATPLGLADINKAAAIISKKLIGKPDTCVYRSNSRPASDLEKLPLIQSEDEAETPVITAAEEKKRHREQYAIEQEEREIEEGLRDNPSLDHETQKAIVQNYRALHQQFKDEGLYQCRYSEYAKESIRYAALFAAFGYFLYIKWYMTSAIFLGLFWVRLLSSFSSTTC